MARFLHPLFFLLAHATDKQLARYLEYLKVENRILRNKLPKRITITPSERAKLVKHGKPLGKAIQELITIVTPRTFARWVNGEGTPQKKPAKPGRPRKPEEIRALIIRMAQDTGWGVSPDLWRAEKAAYQSVAVHGTSDSQRKRF